MDMILFNLKNFYLTVECPSPYETRFHSWSTLYGPCKNIYIVYIAIVLSDAIIFISIVIDAIAFYFVIVYLRVCHHFPKVIHNFSPKS